MLPYNESAESVNHVFAAHAPEMRSRGLAVIPLGPGRKPHINRFNKMRYRPGANLVARWAEQFPDANIGVLPGLSGNGAMVADCDTFDAAEEFQDRFGASDLRVRTRRGVHLWYGKVPFRLPGNLKRLGLEVDLKTGNQIVIAPPSIHETGHIYRLDGCDWDALKRLQSLDAGKLHEFIHGPKQQQSADNDNVVIRPRDPREMRDDSRELWINDTVYGFALSGASWDDALAMAHRLNDTLDSNPKGRLSSDRVFARALKAWQDAQGKHNHQWGGPRRSVVRITRDEGDRLSPDALKLLTKLRGEHSAACERGEDFPIMATRMAKAGFMSRKRIERARNELLRERLIFQTAQFRMTSAGRVAARYSLTSSDIERGGAAAAGQ